MHDAPGQRPLRVDRLPAQNQPRRRARRAHPRHQLRPPSRGDVPQRHLRQRDPRVRRRQPQIAVERQLDPRPEAEAVQRRHRRQRQFLQQPPQIPLPPRLPRRMQRPRRAKLRDVRPRRKRPRPSPREDQGPHIRVERGGVDELPEQVAHLQADRVERLRPRERDLRHPGGRLRVIDERHGQRVAGSALLVEGPHKASAAKQLAAPALWAVSTLRRRARTGGFLLQLSR